RVAVEWLGGEAHRESSEQATGDAPAVRAQQHCNQPASLAAACSKQHSPPPHNYRTFHEPSAGPSTGQCQTASRKKRNTTTTRTSKKTSSGRQATATISSPQVDPHGVRQHQQQHLPAP